MFHRRTCQGPLHPAGGVTLEIVCITLIATCSAGSAWAKSYRAERFEVRAEARPDRSLRVTETITFRFEDGTFTRVFREIPSKKSDGVIDVFASLDGVPLHSGPGETSVAIEEGASTHIEWRFPPATGRHTFTLEYTLRGVVTRERNADTLAWNVLPDEHGYRVDDMDVGISLPAGATSLGAPVVRPSGAMVEVSHQGVRVRARDLGKDRSFRVDLRFAPGVFSAALPAWQADAAARASRGPWMLLLGFVVLVGGFGWLAMTLASWPRYPTGAAPAHSGDTPPDPSMAVAMGAMLGAGRGPAGAAWGTLFDLAARGVLRVEESHDRHWGRRAYRFLLVDHRGDLRPHERALVDLLFGRDTPQSRETTLSRAQRVLSSRRSAYASAIRAEMRMQGLVDPDRQQARASLVRMSLIVLVLGLLAGVMVPVLWRLFGPWTLAVPAAFILVAAVVGAIASKFSVLTAEGARQAGRWRRWFVTLREQSKARDTVLGDARPEWLVWAIAGGIGAAYAKRLAAAPGATLPAWFKAAGGSEPEEASFLALLASSHTTDGGDGGTGAGAGASAGAAGGGSSGAS